MWPFGVLTGRDRMRILGRKQGRSLGKGWVENKPVIKPKNTASFGFEALHF